jgi:hypothetical protein
MHIEILQYQEEEQVGRFSMTLIFFHTLKCH